MAAALLMACVAAVATLLAVAKEQAQATFTGKNGKIAFVSTPGGNPGREDIYTMNPNGTGLDRLTDYPQEDFEPAWSPDGSKIAFVSDRDGNVDIYTVNPNGRHWNASPTHRRPTLTPTGDLSRPPTTGPSR